MNTKKKVIVALSSLAVVVVAAIVAVVAVFAARTTTTNSGFTITYTAIQIKATVTGTYRVNSDETPTAMTPASISFTGSEATDGTANVKQFNSVTVPLTATASDREKYVEFVYTITNNHEQDSLNVVLNADPDTENDNLDYTYTVKIGSAEATPASHDNLVTGLAHGQTATITIKVAVHDLDSNASGNGTFAFVMTKAA